MGRLKGALRGHGSAQRTLARVHQLVLDLGLLLICSIIPAQPEFLLSRLSPARLKRAKCPCSAENEPTISCAILMHDAVFEGTL